MYGKSTGLDFQLKNENISVFPEENSRGTPLNIIIFSGYVPGSHSYCNLNTEKVFFFLLFFWVTFTTCPDLDPSLCKCTDKRDEARLSKRVFSPSNPQQSRLIKEIRLEMDLITLFRESGRGSSSPLSPNFRELPIIRSPSGFSSVLLVRPLARRGTEVGLS